MRKRQTSRSDSKDVDKKNKIACCMQLKWKYTKNIVKTERNREGYKKKSHTLLKIKRISLFMIGKMVKHDLCLLKHLKV